MLEISTKDKDKISKILQELKESGNDSSIQNIQSFIRKSLEDMDFSNQDGQYIESICNDYLNNMLKDINNEKKQLRKEADKILRESDISETRINYSTFDVSDILPSKLKQYKQIMARILELKIDSYPITYLGYELKRIRLENGLF
ncbi:hypothetical protein QYZ88_017245 [Lachnospiraceae bacterium C1.1]|nr:hypothetical protein [Lachnospiraceae bacterium C1.1]